jgi:hypothetical protein
MGVPLEVVAGPLTLWEGPVGETVPDTDEAVAGNWDQIGTSGADNYHDDGVSIVSNQTVNAWRGEGASGVVKLFRTEEDLIIRVSVADMTLEQIAMAFEGNAVASDAGPPAIKTLGLYRGPGEVAQVALLVRGDSPYVADELMQFEIPVCANIGSFSLDFKKGSPAGLLLEYQAIIDPSAATAPFNYGQLTAQTA